MFIIAGSNTYGAVDNIPGLGYVATEFFHLYYLPVIPYRTQFIVRGDAGGFVGGRLPLSTKSILTAWVRAASLIGLLILVLVGVLTLSEKKFDLMTAISWGLGMLCAGGVVVWLHYGLFKSASYSRATSLADELGMDPRLRIYIDMIFERISEQEADKRLDELGFKANELDDLTDELAQSGLDQRFEFR
jgi:hypothetical protein